MFWDGNIPVTGARHRKLKTLIDSDIALYGAHLPLDVHPELGNNTLLARALVSTDDKAALREKPLPEILFLIEAVAARPSMAPRIPPWWNVPAQVAQVLDLVETLREREALGREPAPS